jgi:hypothetical protein
MKMFAKKWMGMAVLACVAWVPHYAAAQAKGQMKDDLFAGTEKFSQGASSVTQIDMDPDSLGMVGGSNSPQARRTVLSVVHTYTYDKPGMYRLEDVEEFRKKLETGDWHCSVHVREMKSGTSTDVCNRQRTDDMVESAIITVEPKSLTFIHNIRKKSGAGQSEMNSFILMNSIHALPALAMLDANLAGLNVTLGDFHVPDMDSIQVTVDSAMKKTLDSAEMQKRIDEAQRQVREAGKRMRELQGAELQKKQDKLKDKDGAGKDVD